MQHKGALMHPGPWLVEGMAPSASSAHIMHTCEFTHIAALDSRALQRTSSASPRLLTFTVCTSLCRAQMILPAAQPAGSAQRASAWQRQTQNGELLSQAQRHMRPAVCAAPRSVHPAACAQQALAAPHVCRPPRAPSQSSAG